MPPKKRTATDDKQLKASVKQLRSKVERADAKAERYKKKLDRLEKTAKETKAQVSKLTKRLDKATKLAKRPQRSSSSEAATSAGTGRRSTTPDQPTLTDAVPTEVSDSIGSGDSASSEVDDTWTVVQLRAEARERGLTGMSNKSKAQLLDALS